MTESPKKLAKQFFRSNSKSYERIVSLTTFGRDAYWKQELLKEIPICRSILDLACGTGILTFQIAKKIPDAKIKGLDITDGYLGIAKEKLRPHHNISFLLCDAEKIILDENFDCIISSYIPKYCDPKIIVENCLYHLNPGGKIVFHDFVYPKNNIIRILWNLYFAILNMAGFLMPSWKKVFRYLPKLIKSSNWIERYKDIMEKNGMVVQVSYLTWGCSAILTGTEKI